MGAVGAKRAAPRRENKTTSLQNAPREKAAVATSASSSMNREPLVASLPVQQRTEASKYAKHMERLQKVKPSVDNGPPRRFISADVRNGKRQMQRQERRFEIEHANAILLDKMQRIVDLGTTASNSGIIHAEEPELTSLNSHVRRQDLERITRENRGIVRRIQVHRSACTGHTGMCLE
jgi:hypothetical protein